MCVCDDELMTSCACSAVSVSSNSLRKMGSSMMLCMRRAIYTYIHIHIHIQKYQTVAVGRWHAPVRMSSCHSSKCFGFLPLASPLPNCSSVAALLQLLQLCCSSSSHSLPHCQIARLIGEECCLGSSALNACLECGGVMSWL